MYLRSISSFNIINIQNIEAQKINKVRNKNTTFIKIIKLIQYILFLEAVLKCKAVRVSPHTCVCVSPREAASSARSGKARYCVCWKRWFSA